MKCRTLIYKALNITVLLSMMFGVVRPAMAAPTSQATAPTAPSERAGDWPSPESPALDTGAPFPDHTTLAIEKALESMDFELIDSGSTVRPEPSTLNTSHSTNLAMALDPVDLALERALGGIIGSELFGGGGLARLELLMPPSSLPTNLSRPSASVPTPPDPLAEMHTKLPQPSDLAALAKQAETSQETRDSVGMQQEATDSESAITSTSMDTQPQSEDAPAAIELGFSISDPVQALTIVENGVAPATEQLAPSAAVSDTTIYLPIIISSGDGTLPPSDQVTVTPEEGGTLNSQDGRVRLEVPPGAVVSETVISYRRSSTQIVEGFQFTGLLFELTAGDITGSEITQFNQDLTLRVQYDEVAGLDEEKLQLYYLNERQRIWLLVSSTVYTQSNEIVATLDHFTRFGVMAPQTLNCFYPVGVGTDVPPAVTTAFSTTFVSLLIPDCPTSDTHSWNDNAPVYVQNFPDAALIYNENLEQAFYLYGPIIRALVDQVPDGPGGWIGLPTSNVDEAGPINEYRDEEHDFTGQPIAYFENGFIGFNGDPDLAEAHRPFPQVNTEVTVTPIPKDTKYVARVDFDFSIDLFDSSLGLAAMEITYSGNAQSDAAFVSGSDNWTPSFEIPLGETVEFWMKVQRSIFGGDNLIGYAPCDHYINDTVHSFTIPTITDTVTTYSFPYTCAGYDGSPPPPDTTPPTIEIIEVYNDGEGSLSILAFIRDDRAVASAEIAGQPGTLSKELTPFIEGGLGADLYAAVFIDVPANQLFDFIIIATDTSGNEATAGGRGFMNYSNFFGADECSISLCGNGYQDKAGNPVTTHLGNKVETFELLDVYGQGLSDIEVDITYNGQSIRQGLFGSAFTSELEWKLQAFKNPLLMGVEVLYPDGRRIKFEENPDGSFTPITNGNADKLERTDSGYTLTTTGNFRYLFDAEGRLVERLDRNSNAITYEYSGNQLVSISTSGRTVTLTHNEDGYIQSLQIGNKVVTLTYDGDILVGIQDPEHGDWVLEYETREIGEIIDERGEEFAYVAYNQFLTSVTTPEGRVKNQQVYDDYGRVTSQTSTAVGELSYEYVENPDGTHETHIADAYGHTESHYYNELGQLWKKTDREGNSEFYYYDDNFYLVHKTDFNGNQWDYARDDKGNIIEISGPLSYHEIWEYNDFNQPTYFKDADSSEWRWEYDAQGNLLKTIRPDDSYSEIFYDSRGLPTDVYDFNGNHTRHEYDLLTGNLIHTWDGEGSLTSFAYDQYGRRKSMIRPNGGVWIYSYDPNDKLVALDGPLGYHVEYIYDADTLLTDERDADGNWTKHVHDERGRLIETYNGEDEPTFFRYGAMNELEEVENARQAITHYTYDKNYRVIQVDMPENVSLSYEYDGMGNVIFATNGRGIVTAYEYDALKRLRRMIQNYAPGVASSADTNVETTYAYDLRGNLIRETNSLQDEIENGYDALGRLIWSENEEDERTEYKYDANSNVTRIQYPEHNTVEMEYNGRDQPTLTRDGESYETRMLYDANGNLEEVIAPDGVVTHYDYNLLDQLVATTDNYVPSELPDHDTNVTTYYQYSLSGDLLLVTNARGYQFSSEYDGAHRLIREVNPAGETNRIYDDAGNLIEKIDANGHSWRYEYDLLNRLTRLVNPEDHAIAFAYDKANNVASMTDARNKTTTTDYDALNRPILIIDPMDYETGFTYDALGNLLAQTDGNGHTTQFKYDRARRLLVRIDAEGYRVEYEYDENGRLILQLIPFDDPDQIIEKTYTYDGRDLLTSFTNGENETTYYAYNSVGLLETRTENDGIVTRHDYDGLRRLSRVTLNYDGTGEEIDDRNAAYNYRYDRVGNLVSVIDPLNQETHFNYDGMNWLIQEMDADGNTWSYEYDPVGNRTVHIDANGNRTDYEYYPDNQLWFITCELGGTTVEHTYDENNNRLTMVDHLGTTTWEYDDLSRVTDVTDPFGRHLGYDYDAVGNRTGLTYPDGRTVTYNYYDNDWLYTVTDPESNVTSYVRDSAGRPTLTTNPNSTVTEMTYDRANRLLTLVNRQVGSENTIISAFTYAYNEVGLRTQMVAEYGWRQPSAVTSTYVYDGLRRLVRDEDSEGVWKEYQFDRASNRLTLHTNDDSTSPRPFDEQTLVYSYSDNNQLLTIVGDTHPGSPNLKRVNNVGQAVYAFRHEVAAQRGKHIEESAADNLLAMANDFIADLESNPAPSVDEVALAVEAIHAQILTDRGSGAIDSDGIANSLLVKLDRADQANNGACGELQTTTFAYDANGNRVNKEFPGPQGPQVQGTDYTYDPENRLIEALDYQMNNQGNRVNQGITKLEYDGDGRRLVKTYDPNEGGGGAKRVEYVFDGLDPVAEYNLRNPQYENYYRGDQGRIITMQHFPNGIEGQMFWYHYDGLGSVSGLTKHLGQSTHNYRYEPYGQIEMPPGNFTDPHNHYTFGGKEWDENMSLCYFGARHYDPIVGVWLTQDTYRGTLPNPLSLHRYGYVQNNPTNLIDLYGFLSWEGIKNWGQSTVEGVGLLAESAVNFFTEGEFATDTTLELERLNEKRDQALDDWRDAKDALFALTLADICSGSHHEVFNRAAYAKSVAFDLADQSNELLEILNSELQDLAAAETTLRITKAVLDLTMTAIVFVVPGGQGVAAARVMMVYDSLNYVIELSSGEFNSPEEAIIEAIFTFAPVVGEVGRATGKLDEVVKVSETIDDLETGYNAVQCVGGDLSSCVDILLNEAYYNSRSDSAQPLQEHHYVTNKSSKWTSQMEEISDTYDLRLNEDWNKELLPHQGRHPDEYHEWVLEQIQGADLVAQGDKEEFLDLFEELVKRPVRENPGMLYKDFWSD